MTGGEPSNAELVRRLDEATAQLSRLADKLERDYVPRELYNSQREADRDDVRDLTGRMNRTEQQRAADRRLIVTAFVAPILTALIMLYVAAQFGGPSL